MNFTLLNVALKQSFSKLSDHIYSYAVKLVETAGKCCSKIFSKWMDKTIHMHTTFNTRIAKPDSLFRINNIHDFIFIESYCLKKEKGTEHLNTLGEYCQIGGRSPPPSDSCLKYMKLDLASRFFV